MSGLCTSCGTVLDDVITTGIHPGCEPEVLRLIRAAARQEREGRLLAEAGKRRALRSNPAQAQTGLELIRLAALRNEFLSADDMRDTFDAAGINTTKAAGGLFSAAVKAGWLVRVSEAPSGGRSAHGKPINHYRSLIFVLGSRRYGKRTA